MEAQEINMYSSSPAEPESTAEAGESNKAADVKIAALTPKVNQYIFNRMTEWSGGSLKDRLNKRTGTPSGGKGSFGITPTYGASPWLDYNYTGGNNAYAGTSFNNARTV